MRRIIGIALVSTVAFAIVVADDSRVSQVSDADLQAAAARATQVPEEAVTETPPSKAVELPRPSGPPSEIRAPILDSGSRRFTFQARLTDPMGDPLPGPTVNLEFQLYNGGGAPLGAPVAVPGQPIVDGIVDAFVPFDPFHFDGAARQVGVRVNGGPELAPRLELGAVPYAYRVDRVMSEELDDYIRLGEPNEFGYFEVFGGHPTPTFVVEAAMGIVSLLNSDNTIASQTFALNGAGYVTAAQNGELNAYLDGASGQVWAESTVSVGDLANNMINVLHGRLSSHSWGGWLQLWDERGNTAVRQGASSSSSGGGFIEVYRNSGGTSVFIDGEDGNGNGLVQVRNSDLNTALELNASDSRLYVFGLGAQEHARLGGTAAGVLQLRAGGANNPMTVNLNSIGNGGLLDLWDQIGADLGVRLQGGASTAGGRIFVYNSGPTFTVDINGDTSSGGGSITLRDGTANRIALDADSRLFQMYDNASLETVRIGASGGGGGGFASLFNSNQNATIELDSDDSPNNQPAIRLNRDDGVNTIEMLGAETATQGGLIRINNGVGQETIELDGDESGSGVIRLRRANGTLGLQLTASEGTGSDLNLYNGAGAATIQIDTDWSGSGNSRIVVDELQISGGSDLSEQFDVSVESGEIEPGMVVCIDPANPGKLVRSEKAHDRTVAGIVSGAGGVKTGMYMGQRGSEADGQHPVALTGRVYCKVDASFGAIQPGNLLTTSPTPGHAMKVTDHASAQGAIIGKAMTGFESGQGLVLVLVSLQ